MTLKKLPFVFLITLFVASLQTTIWPFLAGGIPAPLLWLSVIVYIALNLKFSYAIMLNYSLAIVLTAYTSANLGKLWLLVLILTAAVSYFKSRIYWPGLRYYLLIVFSACIIFHTSSVFISLAADRIPVDVMFFDRFLQVLLTPLLSAPIYWSMELLKNFNSSSDEAPHREEVSL